MTLEVPACPFCREPLPPDNVKRFWKRHEEHGKWRLDLDCGHCGETVRRYIIPDGHNTPFREDLQVEIAMKGEPDGDL